jgi:ubiquinone/menaquinone biosynthesis C-methylase UbiE
MTTNPKRRHFNDLAPRWDQLPGPADPWSRVARFVERATRGQADWILDIGCGTGILLPYLLQACPPVTCVVELDFAEDMLRENARKVPDQRVARLCADAQSLPFPDEHFDLVLCFGVLPHLIDLKAALEELLRVLRPSGGLVVGHLMGSAELNALHRSCGGPVANDTLPPAESLAQMLRQLKATVIAAEESPDCYFVEAAKALP